jgi:hypothetical protein
MSSQKARPSKKSSAKSKSSQQKKKTAKGKPIQIHLTWSGLISWGVFSFVVVAWSFILGVLVGRGYQPESVLPVVAEYMPGHVEEDTQTDPQKQRPVLSAQELGFFENLQAKTGRQEKSDRQQVPVKDQPELEARVTKNEKTYVYAYQVGAFQHQGQAESLRQDLVRSGLSAQVLPSTVQGTPWYRVLVRYAGSPNDVASFTSRLRQAGIENFFLRSKKPK